jgi:cation diffusion facilitator family transporter
MAIGRPGTYRAKDLAGVEVGSPGGCSSKMPNESARTVRVALLAGFCVTVAKVVTAFVTSSPAMAAEAAHSLADTANDLFLLLAQRRSSRPRDEHHPFGYGREAYFWALIAALGAFLGGAAFSLRDGIIDLIHPSATSSFIVAYVVLGIATIFDAVSLRQSVHQMSVEAHLANRSILDHAAMTSDPSLRGIFNEDAVSVAGDVFALAGLGVGQITGSSTPQAIAAVLIALVLIRVSLRLVRRNHDFLVGQPIPAPDRDRVRTFLLEYPGVSDIEELLVTYIGPRQVWVLARINIAENLSSDQVTALVRGIEKGLQHESSNIYRVDVVPVGDE